MIFNNSFEIVKTISGSFVFNEGSLRKLVDLVKQLTPKNNKVEIEVGFEDGLNYKTTDIDRIINEDNRSGKLINKIFIGSGLSSWDNPKNKSIKIQLGSNYLPNEVKITIQGSDRDWVYTSTQKIVDTLILSRQWYSFTASFLFDYIYNTFAYIGVFLIIFILLYTKLQELINNKDKAMLVLLPFSAVSDFILIKFLRWLFPALIFETGAQIQKLESTKAWRSGIFWTVIISGIVIPILSRLI